MKVETDNKMKKVLRNGLVSLLVMLEGLSDLASAVETSKYNNISRMTPSFQIFHTLKKQGFSFDGENYKVRIADMDSNNRPTDGDLMIIEKEGKVYFANQKGAFIKETNYPSINDAMNDINNVGSIYLDEDIIGYEEYQNIIDGVISEFTSRKGEVYVQKKEASKSAKEAVGSVKSMQVPVKKQVSAQKEKIPELPQKKETPKPKTIEEKIQGDVREILNKTERKEITFDWEKDRFVEKIYVPEIKEKQFTFYETPDKNKKVSDDEVYSLANKVKDHLSGLATHVDSLFENGDMVRFRYERTDVFGDSVGDFDDIIFIELPRKSTANPEQRDYEVAFYSLNKKEVIAYKEFWEGIEEILKTRSGTVISPNRVIRSGNRLNGYLEQGFVELMKSKN